MLINNTRFKLPLDYVEQDDVSYFDDAPYADADIVHQPDVYLAADYFLRATGRSQIIDIGCGSGRKLMSIAAPHRIGADFGTNLRFCRERYGDQAEWIESDFSSASCLLLAERANEQTIIVCADVIEHLKEPGNLVSLLRACYTRGAIVITSTPDRIRVRGVDHKGPPPNRSHIREWALLEYQAYLDAEGLPASFVGYTINNNRDRALKTIISVHDLSAARQGTDILRHKPLALLACYNESDVIA